MGFACHKTLLSDYCTTYVNGDIDVIVVPRVYVDGMEASTRAIDNLQPLTLLYCQVDQDRSMWQVCKGLVKKKKKRRRQRVTILSI